MEPFDIKINYLVVEIITNDNFFFLLWNPTSPSLFSHPKKDWKMKKKIKFGTKIEFLKIKRINYLIAKKNGGLN
jgi:hypothetical protein